MQLTVGFDLSDSGVLCNGKLSFRDGAVYTELDGKKVFESSLEGIEEICLRTYVGCGVLELMPADSLCSAHG